MRGLRFDRLDGGAALALPLTAVLAIRRPARTPTPDAGGDRIRRPDAGAARRRRRRPRRDARAGRRPRASATPAATPLRPTAAPHPRRHRRRRRPRRNPRRRRLRAATAARPPAEARRSAASLDPADRPIAEKLRDLLPPRPTAPSRAARSATRSRRSTRRATTRRCGSRRRADRARQGGHRASAGVDADGLDPGRLSDAGARRPASPDALAEAELRLTATLLTFARHLQAGRFPFTRISAEIELPQDAAGADGRARPSSPTATDVAAALDSFNPPQPGYQRAQGQARRAARQRPARRAEGRAHSGRPDAAGPARKTPRVPLLRQRLNVAGDDDQPALRRGARRRGRRLPEANGMNADGIDRRRARCAASSGRGAAPQRRDRHHHRQYGALALDAARPRQHPRRCSTSRTTRCA